MKSLGELLKEYRKQHNLTQLQMADRIGLSVGGYQKFERDERVPRVSVLRKISKKLNIPFEKLLQPILPPPSKREGKIIRKEDLISMISDENSKISSNPLDFDFNSFSSNPLDFDLHSFKLKCNWRDQINSKVKELFNSDYVRINHKINKNSISESQINEVSLLLEEILELKLAQIKLKNMEDILDNGKT